MGRRMKGEDTLMACGPAVPCSNCVCPFRPRACRGFHPGVGEPPARDELNARLARDLERGTTSAGPHLHDIAVLAGDRDLRAFGSQGEQRLGVLALLLAEAEVLAARHDVAPLLLLDDVLSELDVDRRRTLASLLPEHGQTLITSTSPDALPVAPSQLLVVSPGEVRAA